MTAKWFNGKPTEQDNWSGFLESGVRLVGNLESTGTFRVNASVNGNLSSERTLLLGEEAEVRGEISATVIIVSGKFNGVLRARERVEIQANALVTGEIHSPCLIIAAGAIFDGTCSMLPETPAAKTLTIPIRSAAQGS